MKNILAIIIIIFVWNAKIFAQISQIEHSNLELILGLKILSTNNISEIEETTKFYSSQFGELKPKGEPHSEIINMNEFGFPIIQNKRYNSSDVHEAIYYAYDYSVIRNVNYAEGKIIPESIDVYSNNSFLTVNGDLLIKFDIEKNRILKKNVYCLKGRCEKGSLINTYTYFYDNKGRVIRCENTKNKSVTEYSYNKHGLLKEVFRYRKNNDNKLLPLKLPRYKREIQYNDKGFIISNKAYKNDYVQLRSLRIYNLSLEENIKGINDFWQLVEDDKDEIGNYLGEFSYNDINSFGWVTKTIIPLDNEVKNYDKAVLTREYRTLDDVSFAKDKKEFEFYVKGFLLNYKTYWNEKQKSKYDSVVEKSKDAGYKNDIRKLSDKYLAKINSLSISKDLSILKKKFIDEFSDITDVYLKGRIDAYEQNKVFEIRGDVLIKHYEIKEAFADGNNKKNNVYECYLRLYDSFYSNDIVKLKKLFKVQEKLLVISNKEIKELSKSLNKELQADKIYNIIIN